MAGNRNKLKTREVTSDTDDNQSIYCEVHQTRKVAMYCEDCECSVCLACIAGDHAKHVFKEIPDMIQSKAVELSKILALFQEEALPVLTEKLRNVRTERKYYQDRCSECVAGVRAHGQMVKEHVNWVIDEHIEELKNQEKGEMDCFTKTESRLTERLSNINDFLTRGQELLKSQDAGLVSFVTEAKQQLNIKEDFGPTESGNLPEIDPSQIDRLLLQKLFGHMISGTVLGSIDNKAQSEREEGNQNSRDSTDYEAQFERDEVNKSNSYDDHISDVEIGSDFVEPNQCIRQTQELRHFSNRAVKIATTFPHPKRAVNVCALSGKQAWVSGDGYLELLTCDGEIEKSVPVNFFIYGMTLTKKGEVLFGKGGQIKKMTGSGKFVDFAKTSPFDVYGIVATGDQILACMYDGIHVGKVEKLSYKGKVLQTIQFDRNKRPLFGMPIYITQIDCGDIWVSDRNNNCVVVLTAEGELKFRYRGPDLEKPFKPKYLSSDRVGHVLINDIATHNIHLVDLDGYFVQFLLTQDHGFDGRWALAQEKDNFIWMACAAHKTIIIFQKL